MEMERAAELSGPAATVLVTAGVVLLAGLVVRNWRLLPALALLGLAASALQTILIAARGRHGDAFQGQLVVDNFAIFFLLLFAAVGAVIVIASFDDAEQARGHESEYLTLLLCSIGGLMFLSSSRDLVSIYVSLELTGISQYALAAILRSPRSAEAGLKYLLLGATSSAVLLYGMTMLFGLTGSTLLTEIGTKVRAIEGSEPALIMTIVFLLAGFSFKMSILPFYMWAPDVYQGSPAPVAAYLSVASKAAAFAVVIRVFFEAFGDEVNSETWSIFLAVVAAFTMTIGNAMALWQSNIRRLLGYSSVAQAGNFLIGVAAVTAVQGLELGASSVIFFIAAYAFTNLGAFLAVIAISNRIGSDEIADYAGMFRRQPALAIALAICFLSLTGLPPTAGFIAKLYIFDAAVQSDLVWLVVIAVLNTAISAYYYLGFIRVLFRDAEGAAPVRAGWVISGAAALAALGVVFFGIVPGPLFDAAREAASTFARG